MLALPKIRPLCLIALSLVATTEAHAAGTLTLVGSTTPMRIVQHDVRVVLDNGYARTEVTQRFHNDADTDADAVYEFPVPPDAALSEMTLQVGERTLRGEVVENDQAQTIYDDQNAAGQQAGLATQQSYETFRFDVANVPAGGEAEMTFVYYEKLVIDTGVARYLYPLEDGGTRDAAETAFWTTSEAVDGPLSFDLELKSAVAVDEVRVTNAPSTTVDQLGDGHYHVHLEQDPATLGQDLVFYYRLPDDQPGRIEVVPYRADTESLGTFMMVLTPGVDLRPLDHGKNTVFVVDSSGSMDTKLATLQDALGQSLQRLSSEDRFRVVEFDDAARDVSGGYLAATPENVSQVLTELEGVLADGGTNLYEGIDLGLSDLEDERVTQVVLITDGVANEGIVDPVRYDALLRESDARVFGLLLGNMANWPLMEIITEASGGFYAAVSNADDILGQVMLADSKMTHEALHDAVVSLTGVEVSDTTDFDFGKVYRGQQLVVFGRYASGGAATVALDARISGRDEHYAANFSFPDVDQDNPELERLWALEMIHAVEQQALLGLLSPDEAADEVRRLGIEYSLVTTETSMLVVDDSVFDANGIDRSNLTRTQLEEAAAVRRSGSDPVDYRVDQGQGTFPGPAASLGSSTDDEYYGGALDPTTGALAALFGIGLHLAGRRRREALPR